MENIGFIWIVVAAVLIVLIYYLAYRRRMDRALAYGEPHNRRHLPDVIDVITVVFCAVILLLLISVNAKLVRCQEEIGYLRAEEDRDVETLKKLLNSQAERSKRLVGYSSSEITDWSSEKNTADLRVAVWVKYYTPDTEVTLDYYGQHEMRQEENGRFTADIQDVPLFVRASVPPQVTVKNGDTVRKETLETDKLFDRTPGWSLVPHLSVSAFSQYGTRDGINLPTSRRVGLNVSLKEGRDGACFEQPVSVIVEQDGAIILKRALPAEEEWTETAEGRSLTVGDLEYSTEEYGVYRIYLEARDSFG